MAVSNKAQRGNPRNDLSAKFVRSILFYSAKTGVFRWRKNGKIAGSIDGRGYIKIQIATRKYTASRLAWLIKTGHWPKDEIDHKNRKQSDNRWCNLRQSNPTNNNQNRVAWNKSKLPGAHWHYPTQKWISVIHKNKKKMYLGLFNSAKKASIAYRKAARKLYHT